MRRTVYALLKIAAGLALWFGRPDHFTTWTYGHDHYWVPIPHLLFLYGGWDLLRELVWKFQSRRRRKEY